MFTFFLMSLDNFQEEKKSFEIRIKENSRSLLEVYEQIVGLQSNPLTRNKTQELNALEAEADALEKIGEKLTKMSLLMIPNRAEPLKDPKKKGAFDPRMLPKDLPIFKKTQSADVPVDLNDFIYVFESRMEACAIQSEHWSAILLSCVPTEDIVTLRWLKDNVSDLSWTEVKFKLIEHFQTPNVCLFLKEKFRKIAPQPGEYLPNFVDRFTGAMQSAKCSPEDMETCSLFLKCLPIDIYQMVISAVIGMTNVYSIINHVLRVFYLKSTPNVAPKMNHNWFCTFCNLHGHTKEYCRAKDSQRLSRNEKTRQDQRYTQSTLKEYTRGEKLNTPRASKKTINMVQNSDSDEKEELQRNSINGETSFAYIRVPCLLNQVPILATLDTGAQLSVISRSILGKIRSSVSSSPNQRVRFAEKNSIAKHHGFTGQVAVEVGVCKSSHSFLVLDMNENTDCLIGLDLLEKIGVSIFNIPFQYPSASSERPAVGQKNKTLRTEEMAENEASLEVPCTLKEQKQLLAEIKKLIQENLKTSGAFCNLPEATVHLDTGANKASFVKQYRIPYRLNRVFEETINKWLEKQIIIDSPVGCAWNSPLLAVPKKDANGNFVKSRVCLDPRHINNILADDKFPIPSLSELLDRVAGSAYFSSLDLEWSYHQFPLAQNDQEKTAFTYNGQQYMF